MKLKQAKENNCSNCGHKNSPTRIDREYIKTEFQSLISLEKGFLYTVMELIIKPRTSIRDYFYNNRNRLVKPITFAIFCTTISVIVKSIFNLKTNHFEEEFERPKEGLNNAIIEVMEQNREKIEFFSSNDGFMNIVLIFFIALWLKFFLRKTNLNFFEILVLVSYTIGVLTLLGSILIIIEWSFNIQMTGIPFLLGCIYSASMVGRFLGEKKIKNYMKGALSYVLGFLTMALTIIFTISGFATVLYLYEK